MSKALRSLMIVLPIIAYDTLSLARVDQLKDLELVELRGTEIVSISQSGLRKYEDWFLFVIRATSLKSENHDGMDAEYLSTPSMVEVLAPKSSCYHEILAASSWSHSSSAELVISNVHKVVFKATPNDSHHDFFLKISPVVNEDSFRAKCIFNRQLWF